MKRALRITCIGVGVFALLGAVLLGVAMTIISPNDFKPQIEAMVLKTCGKRLVLQGDLKLSLFPRIGVTTGPAELAADPAFGPAPLLRVDSVNASVAVMPLLRGVLDIGTVSFSGVRLALIINEAGTPNWAASAPATPAAAPQPQQPGKDAGKEQPLDLAAIKLDRLLLTDIALSYTDMRTNERLAATISQLDLTDLAAGGKTGLALTAAMTRGDMPPIALRLKASFSIPASSGQELPFAAEGTLDETPFSFKGTATLPIRGKDHIVGLTADITAGDVVLNKYLPVPAKGASRNGSAATPAQGSGASLDAAVRRLLHALDLNLRLRIKSLTASGLPMKDIAATIKTSKGLATVAPLSMVILGGGLTTDLAVDVRGNAIRSRMNGAWKNARAEDIAFFFAGKKLLTGTFGATWDIAGTGLAWAALARTLGGKAAFALENGAIPTFRSASLVLPGLPAAGIDLDAVSCTATWNIADGIATNNDMTFKATGISANGRGEVSIPSQTINYKARVNLPHIRELPGPTKLTVAVTGPLAAPALSLEQGELLRETAKSLLNPNTRTGQEIRRGINKGINSFLNNLRQR